MYPSGPGIVNQESFDASCAATGCNVASPTAMPRTSTSLGRHPQFAKPGVMSEFPPLLGFEANTRTPRPRCMSNSENPTSLSWEPDGGLHYLVYGRRGDSR